MRAALLWAQTTTAIMRAASSLDLISKMSATARREARTIVGIGSETRTAFTSCTTRPNRITPVRTATMRVASRRGLISVMPATSLRNARTIVGIGSEERTASTSWKIRPTRTTPAWTSCFHRTTAALKLATAPKLRRPPQRRQLVGQSQPSRQYFRTDTCSCICRFSDTFASSSNSVSASFLSLSASRTN